MALAAKWPVVDMFAGLSGVCVAHGVWMWRQTSRFHSASGRAFSISRNEDGCHIYFSVTAFHPKLGLRCSGR